MKNYISVVLDNSPVRFNIETDENNIKIGDFIIVETSRGYELAKCIDNCKKEENIVIKENVEENVENDANDLINEKISFVKLASEKDINIAQDNKKFAENIKNETIKLISKLNLAMKVSATSVNLDKSKASIFFTSENRVDFRNLVKELANIFKIRIELRQIGSRDEVRYMGSLGLCGKECCCKQFINQFEHVSIKMAKNQNLSLNPQKISGVCGRLLCCLGYENEHYAEALKLLPKVGNLVKTPFGEGKVVYNDILKRIVQVKIGDENNYEIKNFNLDEIEIMKGKNEVKKK